MLQFEADPVQTHKEIQEKISYYKYSISPVNRIAASLPRKITIKGKKRLNHSNIDFSSHSPSTTSRFIEQTNKEIEKIYSLRNEVFKPYIHDLVKGIMDSDFWYLFQAFIPTLEYYQIDLSTFIRILTLLGDFALENNLHNQASFLFNQLVIISEIISERLIKIKSFIAIAESAKRIKCYSHAIQILKKALMYAWAEKNHFTELYIYDQIGLNYFYLGNIKQAEFYHSKFIYNEIEENNGYFRNISEKIIGYFEQTIPYKTKVMDKLLIIKLSLPIQNIFENNKVDQFRTVSIYNCDCKRLLDQIISGWEFKFFDYEYFQTKVAQKKRDDFYPIPKYIAEMRERYQKKNQKKTESKTLKPIGQIWEQISQSIKSSKLKLGDLMEQTYVRHLQQKPLNQELTILKKMQELRVLIEKAI